jgi:hypothetical protein
MDRADVFLEDDLLSGGGTDDVAQPSEVGWTPGSPARVPDVMPSQERVETQLGGLQIPANICTRAAPVTAGLLVNRGDIDGVRSPERISRARWIASRRSVFTRSPAFFGISEGATTQQTSPLFVRSR